MKILVAGGAGYIGSHTCVALIEAGNEIIIVDSLVNSQKSTIKSLQTITNRKVEFIEADRSGPVCLNSKYPFLSGMQPRVMPPLPRAAS